jgi:hypothetical protein
MSATVYLKDITQSNQLLKELLSEHVTIVHFEIIQDSLKDERYER